MGAFARQAAKRHRMQPTEHPWVMSGGSPMQTLNVGAGRTDQEYKAAEEQRRADLRADSQSDANYFFWAAALAAIASGLLPVRINIIVNIGAFDLLNLFYIREF